MVSGPAATQKHPLWLVPPTGGREAFADAYLERAARAAKRILDERRRDAPFVTPVVEATFGEAAKLIDGGKKLRGGLLVLGFTIAHGEESLQDRIVDASIGYEFLHSAFLVHDDIMDRATLRRSNPTAAATFTALAPTRDLHYGVSQAINLGDMIAFWGTLYIAHPQFPGSRVAHAMNILNRAVETTIIGQTLDIDPNVSLATLSEDYVLAIVEDKTAHYSFVTPLQIGAVLGGMSPESDAIRAMADFGVPVGIAFQFQDDDLGVYGNESKIGKSVTSDLVEGKRTLLFFELYRRLDGRDRERFAALWGNAEVSDADLDWVRRKGEQSGAREAVNRRLHDLVAKAKSAIPRVTDDPPIQEVLSQIADFAIVRDS